MHRTALARSLRIPLVLAALTASTAATADDGAVIPPGQEELLADMLGKGAALPGGCAWNGAAIEKVVVLSRYTCGGSELVVELRHLDPSAKAAARTEQFALSLQSGAAPPGLVEALAARIREREASFHWQHPKPSPPGPGRLSRGAAMGIAGGAMGAVAVAGLVVYLVRRRRMSTKPEGEQPASPAP